VCKKEEAIKEKKKEERNTRKDQGRVYLRG
jgi:hypothetical protein